MAIRVTRNPAVLRLGMLISLIFVIALYSAILSILSTKGNKINFCVSNTTINTTCWDGKLLDVKNKIHCPFTLAFVTVMFFAFSLLAFLLAGIVKCLHPEILLRAYRQKCLRRLNQYYLLILHLIGTGFSSAFLVLTIKNFHADDSCYFYADMIANCTQHRGLCWMFCFTVVGFVSSFSATIFSMLEARKFYVERLEDEMCDQLYTEYLMPGSESELLNTWPE